MQIKKGTITGDLKHILHTMGIIPWMTFSDSIQKGKAVSVKLSGIRLHSSQVQFIVDAMSKMGHQLLFDKAPALSKTQYGRGFCGHRLAFWKGDLYCKNLEKVLE